MWGFNKDTDSDYWGEGYKSCQEDNKSSHFKVPTILQNLYTSNRYGIIEVSFNNDDIGVTPDIPSVVEEEHTIIAPNLFYAANVLSTLMIDDLVCSDEELELSECVSRYKLNLTKVDNTEICEVYIYFLDDSEEFVYEKCYVAFKID